jgi:ABC-type proline/glycine betaine transport system permease subunit
VVVRERTSLVIAFVAALVGLVWIAQGLGAPIGKSFMIGDPRWTVAGLVLVAVAALVAARGLRRSR